MTRSRRVRLAAVGVGAVLLLAVSYAVAGTAHRDDSDEMSLSGLNEPDFDAVSGPARAAPTVGELREKVGALRGPPAHSMPAGLRAKLATPLKQQFGSDFSGARKLSALGQELTVWLIPGEKALCLVIVEGSDGGGSTCQRPGSDASQLSITRRVPGAVVQQQLIGVAPDGVKAVTARFADGRTREASVVNNLYVVDDAVDLTGVEY